MPSISGSKSSKGIQDRFRTLEGTIFELRNNETTESWQKVNKALQVIFFDISTDKNFFIYKTPLSVLTYGQG